MNRMLRTAPVTVETGLGALDEVGVDDGRAMPNASAWRKPIMGSSPTASSARDRLLQPGNEAASLCRGTRP
jgi:hypothetical protein